MRGAGGVSGIGWEGAGTVFFFQAEDGIRDSVASRGLGDVYKKQVLLWLGFVHRCMFRSNCQGSF